MKEYQNSGLLLVAVIVAMVTASAEPLSPKEEELIFHSPSYSEGLKVEEVTQRSVRRSFWFESHGRDDIREWEAVILKGAQYIKVDFNFREDPSDCMSQHRLPPSKTNYSGGCFVLCHFYSTGTHDFNTTYDIVEWIKDPRHHYLLDGSVSGPIIFQMCLKREPNFSNISDPSTKGYKWIALMKEFYDLVTPVIERHQLQVQFVFDSYPGHRPDLYAHFPGWNSTWIGDISTAMNNSVALGNEVFQMVNMAVTWGSSWDALASGEFYKFADPHYAFVGWEPASQEAMLEFHDRFLRYNFTNPHGVLVAFNPDPALFHTYSSNCTKRFAHTPMGSVNRTRSLSTSFSHNGEQLIVTFATDGSEEEAEVSLHHHVEQSAFTFGGTLTQVPRPFTGANSSRLLSEETAIHVRPMSTNCRSSVCALPYRVLVTDASGCVGTYTMVLISFPPGVGPQGKRYTLDLFYPDDESTDYPFYDCPLPASTNGSTSVGTATIVGLPDLSTPTLSSPVIQVAAIGSVISSPGSQDNFLNIQLSGWYEFDTFSSTDPDARKTKRFPFSGITNPILDAIDETGELSVQHLTLGLQLTDLAVSWGSTYFSWNTSVLVAFDDGNRAIRTVTLQLQFIANNGTTQGWYIDIGGFVPSKVVPALGVNAPKLGVGTRPSIAVADVPPFTYASGAYPMNMLLTYGQSFCYNNMIVDDDIFPFHGQKICNLQNVSFFEVVEQPILSYAVGRFESFVEEGLSQLSRPMLNGYATSCGVKVQQGMFDIAHDASAAALLPKDPRKDFNVQDGSFLAVASATSLRNPITTLCGAPIPLDGRVILDAFPIQGYYNRSALGI